MAYYRTTLKQRGEVVFEEPPVHMFDVGRFREETMAFPPGVTVKDYTWGGSAGYLNPKPARSRRATGRSFRSFRRLAGGADSEYARLIQHSPFT